MSIPSGVNRVVFVGNLGQGEQFNFGFWTAGDVPASAAAANTFAAGVKTVFDSGGADAALLGCMSSDAALTAIKTYHYPTGGPNATYQGQVNLTGYPGTSTETSLPIQCALVFTLRTGLPGRSRRGRMYLPLTARTLTSHQLTSTVLNTLTDQIGGFFTDLNTAVGLGTVSVVSQIGTGSTAPVTRVEADSRVDIQRRRANRETELYQATGWNV